MKEETRGVGRRLAAQTVSQRNRGPARGGYHKQRTYEFSPVTRSLRSTGYQNPHKNSLAESAELGFKEELILRSIVAQATALWA